MRDYLKNCKQRIDHMLHKHIHKAEHFFHCTYLSAVAVEAHGFYAIAAAVLLIVVVMSWFVGEL